ncbi:putative MFS transporter [Actinoplanes missouriensis 431]|uniref:Putative MFS transporter n=1 Tax=Actinoplanes missouriensis (strain ATCC 14538 / DSM 43046 / CBS 188.64 / JCM 3121 / NBRC 102363 / NCIMB 12654 / NRRL B-3342 / UNCC 431) TaxID=512565 RepID=I0H5Z7_ACTM4|nr:MFS transporter [Actinoplanes missouriensis]BAL88434.1 putative MFS transporter [Actinoplanes missouriensis 431]
MGILLEKDRDAVAIRCRAMPLLFAAVALTNTAMVASTTVATLIVADHAGSGVSGFANAAAVLGSAAGAFGLGALTVRHGGRRALLTVYLLGFLGCLVALLGGAGGLLPALLAGMVAIGIGNGGAQVCRYLATELYPEDRKAFGLSVIVWAGTVGALAGPTLIAPAGRLAVGLGLPELSGALLLAAAMTAASVLITLALPAATGAAAHTGRPPLTWRALGAALGRPAVRLPLTAMLGAHLSMVTIMTMTPLQLHEHHQGLGTVGWVLSAHMVGMFALAPLSGRIADRFGGRVAIGGGTAMLVAAALLVVTAPTAYSLALPAALFLLGYGWNLVFVGSSGLLSSGLETAERVEVQGGVDAIVFVAAIAVSLVASATFAGGGFAVVAVVGGVIALAPVPLLVRGVRWSLPRD